MFATDAFLQYVFADKNDSYYCDNLLQLNLNQYLWLKLHDKYDVVYLLKAEKSVNEVDRGPITVYAAGNVLLPNHKQGWTVGVKIKFLEIIRKYKIDPVIHWIGEMLTNSEKKCAFVCSLEDFCSCFGEESRAKYLNDIVLSGERTGTIVLTLSPEVERTHELLFRSKVFDCLGDHGIEGLRDSTSPNCYDQLIHVKGDACVFLNTFTKERIGNLLLHVLIRMNRWQSETEVQEMAAYLTQYMNNRILQWRERESTVFRAEFSPVNALYCDLYQQLTDDIVWNKLLKKTEQIREAGGLAKYMDSMNVVSVNEKKVRITYKRDSAAWQCMNLLPGACLISSDEDGSKKILNDIWNELRDMRSGTMDAVVMNDIEKMLRKLREAASYKDKDSCRRILRMIRFCLKHRFDSMATEKIRNVCDNYIQISISVHRQQKEMENGGKSCVAQINDSLLEKQKQILEQMDSVIEMYQTKDRDSPDIAQLIKTLQTLIPSSPETSPKPEEAVEEEPKPEKTVDEVPDENKLKESLRNIIPPDYD